MPAFSPYKDLTEYEKGSYKVKAKQRASNLSTSPSAPQVPRFAIVLHAVPAKHKLGEVRRWLEQDNRYLYIARARRLLTED